MEYKINKLDTIIQQGEKMEKSTKTLIQQQNQELVKQNQNLTAQFQTMMQGIIEKSIEPLIIQNNQLMQEIKTLKAEQKQIVKEAVAEAIKTQMTYLIDKQVEKIIEKINAQGDRLSDNQKELAKYLVDFKEEVTDYIANSNKNEKEMLEEGEKILDMLDDLGKGLINAHSGLTDLQNFWGKHLGDGLGKVAIGIEGLAKRMDNAERNVINNQEHTYKAVKDVNSLINRKSW